MNRRPDVHSSQSALRYKWSLVTISANGVPTRPRAVYSPQDRLITVPWIEIRHRRLQNSRRFTPAGTWDQRRKSNKDMLISLPATESDIW